MVYEHRKTMTQLKDKESKLKLNHKVPKEVEMTPVLQKLIAVGTKSSRIVAMKPTALEEKLRK